MPKETPICPYCERPSKFLKSSATIYGGRDFGPVYRCDDCDAHVGCHPGTTTPLGRLANPELRSWKQKAHRAFDPLWKTKLRKVRKCGCSKFSKSEIRGQGYQWLADQLGIPVDDCHIGMFDVDQCKRVVELCDPIARRISK